MRWRIRVVGRNRSRMLRACRWFLRRSGLAGRKRTIVIRVVPYSKIRCYGTSEQVKEGCYECFVAEQDEATMTSTLLHEMVHVEQWERGSWQGEGEREALRREKELMKEHGRWQSSHFPK